MPIVSDPPHKSGYAYHTSGIYLYSYMILITSAVAYVIIYTAVKYVPYISCPESIYWLSTDENKLPRELTSNKAIISFLNNSSAF